VANAKKKEMKKILITIGLVIGGFILSFVCLEEANITSLLTYHGQDVYVSSVAGPIMQGNSMRGEFRAIYDNLGMVKLRMRTFNRMNTTHIRFLLREKGSNEDWVTNTYATDRFVDGLFYPFGFPVIADSKGKTYEFKLESLDGTSDDAIGVFSGYHNVATQYVFQKSILLGDRQLLKEFLFAKVKSILTDPYMILYFSIFLVPAYIYIVKRHKEMLMMYALLVYVFVPLSIHSNTILVIAALMLGVGSIMHVAASRMYVIALVWIIAIPILLACGNVLAADRAATLVFFLILIGVIMSLRELKKH
jgi:hypothetical protein